MMAHARRKKQMITAAILIELLFNRKINNNNELLQWLYHQEPKQNRIIKYNHEQGCKSHYQNEGLPKICSGDTHVLSQVAVLTMLRLSPNCTCCLQHMCIFPHMMHLGLCPLLP